MFSGLWVGSMASCRAFLFPCGAPRPESPNPMKPSEPRLVSMRADPSPSADYRSPDALPFAESAFLDLSHCDKLGTIRSARMLARKIRTPRIDARVSESRGIADIRHAHAIERDREKTRLAVNARARAVLQARAYLARFPNPK